MKPIILTVDDDPRVLIAIKRDLERQYEKRYRIVWPLERLPLLLETIIPGIFAAGDVRHGSVKRIAAGVGEGSTAIH